MSKQNSRRKIILSGLVVATVASLGGSFYFLNQSTISADISSPGLPSIPGIPLDSPATSQVNFQIQAPPLPPAPINNPSDDTSVSQYSLEDSSRAISNSSNLPESSSGVLPNESQSTLPGAPEEPVVQMDTNTSNQTLALQGTNQPIGAEAETQVQSNSKTLGMAAAVVAVISFLLILLLLARWKKPSPSSPQIPQI